MKKNNTISHSCFVLGLLFYSSIQAQESLNSAGGNATGSGGSVSYTVGQIPYHTYIGNSGSLAEGVQHAYEIYQVGIEETSMDLSISLYPNPSSDYIVLKTVKELFESLTFQLFDSQGKKIDQGQISAEETIISMKVWSVGTYYVDIFNQQNNKIQSFKIIKN